MRLVSGLRINVISLLCIFTSVVSARQYGTRGNTLYVANEKDDHQKLTVINRYPEEIQDSLRLERRKRDASSLTTPVINKNISTWTTHLNDSHQQLMVHWVGEGSNVIICLAKDTSPRNKGELSPSTLFISYDYGKNFTNKTEDFKLSDDANSSYAQLDKFFNHPKYPEFCVFVDSANKKLYFTSDNGHTIHRTDLDFHPSELAFDDEFPDKFVILDKIDSNRKLYLTLDGGKTFKHIQSYVKTFFWPGYNNMFYVERWKPDGTSTVMSSKDPVDVMTNSSPLFTEAKDFQIKGDYMFATKQSKEKNNLDLYISHQRGPFFKAEFQTELDRRKFHIADVTDKRIFVSVMHTEGLANLYVSEISKNFTQYNFVLSLEQILCYFPDGNWKDSWLEDVAKDPFTDLYRVEGLKGIYIASRVDSKASVSNIGPEHLISLITFDHGVTWSHITPPSEDEHGKPLSCHIENSCSLHLCQKFSQLYPVTSPPGMVENDFRSASIMSSKSAPGILMATGVMGKSLKGIPGVYLSRDAGLTWKRILKEYYFFNYGDHGGVLVAVKYFKTRGNTREILYSTNEGIDWNSYEFNSVDLRIYGLMTEPGENTTTFTMFGSENDQHQWIIITTDLRNTFARNCTTEDYKFWSPSPPNSSVSCVLGTRNTFQRRLAHTNCYNGIDYDRPVMKEVCECSRRDFECDFGFMLSGNECVRNKTTKNDPYEVPKDCSPGLTYKRTKGYRKIDGDVCTTSAYLAYNPDTIPCPIKEPVEFILVALRERIAQINLAENTTIFPVTDQKNIVAIEVDVKNNCIYWADIDLDKISRQCFDGKPQEVIVDTDLASIEGMALDYISNVLFFVDGMRRKIEAVRTDLTSEGRMRTTILDSKVLSKPRGIAVHPKAGYLYWTDWDRSNPAVSRSNLDGTDVKKLFGKPLVQWPNGITIDQISERIYWVDAMEDYIASADLNGRNFRKILWDDDKVSHPFAVAVLKDKMYWDDWKSKSIYMADKDIGSNIYTINDSLIGLMDLKVYAHFVQLGTNACSFKNTSCDALCLGGPGNTFSCLCPDGFVKVGGKCMCLNGMEPSANMTCPKTPGAGCGSGQFTCKSGMCIESFWHCDGNNDCGDMSDEVGCMCTSPMLACDNTKCYLPHWRCDGDADCADLSDEKDCGPRNCSADQFQCANGNCIEKKWICDGDNDCKDGSDERNCTIRQHNKATGSCHGFDCGDGLCLPNSWVCDGEADCPNGEDEKCVNTTCAPYMFRCPSGKCISKSWVCDGENDCTDLEASDEKNCNGTHPMSKLLPWPSTEKSTNISFNGSSCLDWMFRCDNGNCMPYWWRCDAVDDCGDNSDEAGCNTKDVGWRNPDQENKPVVCGKNQFTCSQGMFHVCIPLSWVCDSANDCVDGSDEQGCPARKQKCVAPMVPCPAGCCDPRYPCTDPDDPKCKSSRHKTVTDKCPNMFLQCDAGRSCIPYNALCDGHQDCFDGSDEANCTSDLNPRMYQFLSVGVDQSSINSTSFLISCWMAQQKMVVYSFLPSIANVKDGVWKNMTWTNDSTYRFTNLEPYTNYNVTFYIRDSKSNRTNPSNKYVTATTGEGVPSPPVKLTVRQGVGSQVAVVWDQPKDKRGVIQYYTLYFAPPIPPIKKTFPSGNQTTFTAMVHGYFQPNTNYSFWMTATNNAYTSLSTEVEFLVFDKSGDVDEIVNVSMSRNETAVKLQWHKIRGVQGYKVQVRLPFKYFSLPPVVTQDDNAVLTNLPSGVLLYIDIMAYKNDVTGKPFTIPLRIEGEPDETLNLSAILLKEKRTSVLLKWSPPTGDRYKGKELTYQLHYTDVARKNDENNTKSIITKNTTVLVEGLNVCESYAFSVGLLGGPLSRIVEIITRENPKAAVKNLHITYNEDRSNLEIHWNANCDVITEAVPYRLTVTELTHNVVSRFELPPKTDVSLLHVFKIVPEGGRYNVCVSASLPGSVKTCVLTHSKLIETPKNLMAWWSPNGHVMVSWHSLEQNDIKYEVIVSTKEIPTDLLHPTEDMKVVEAEYPPLLMNADTVLGPQMYVSVRAVSKDGYCSDLSEVQPLRMEGLESAAEPSTTAAIWWGACAALVVSIALGGALLHVALRNRRLTRSFLRLTATPRYDSRRSQATIDNDDDDVPPIQGFSDDEPLVIA